MSEQQEPVPAGDDGAALALARLDKMEAEAERRYAEASAGATRTEQVAPTGVSDRGWVTVVLTPQALVSEIELAEGAPVTSPTELATAVKQAHDRALEQWRREIDEIADDELSDPRLRADVQRATLAGLPERLRPRDDDAAGTDGHEPVDEATEVVDGPLRGTEPTTDTARRDRGTPPVG